MPITHVNYHGLSLPCSRAGVKPPDNRYTAKQLVTRCDQAGLLNMGRPTDEEIRLIWMQRFVNEMHWLPLIEALSGCHPGNDPVAHEAFVAVLASRDVPRIAHRPWGKSERYRWGFKLSDRIKPLCPDSAAQGCLRSAFTTFQYGTGDAIFVTDGCIAAAEEARPACMSEPPWLFYKAVTFIRGQLPVDEHRLMLGYRIGDHPSAVAYFDFLNGRGP